MSDLQSAVDAVIAEAKKGLVSKNGLVSFYSKGRPRIMVILAVGEFEHRLTDLLDDPETFEPRHR